MEPSERLRVRGNVAFGLLADFDALSVSLGISRSGRGVARDGHSIGTDDKKQLSLYQKACGGGDAEGCDWLADCYEEGTAVPQSDSLAKANYTKACKMGSSDACSSLTKLVEDRRSLGIQIP